MSDLVLILLALAFFFISLGILYLAHQRHNKLGQRTIIRGRYWYFVVASLGMVVILLGFAWLFSDILLGRTIFDLTTIITVLCIAPAPLMVMLWGNNKIILNDETIDYHEGLSSDGVVTIKYSKITHVEMSKSKLHLEDSQNEMNFDSATYGSLDDLRELLRQKVDEKIIIQK